MPHFAEQQEVLSRASHVRSHPYALHIALELYTPNECALCIRYREDADLPEMAGFAPSDMLPPLTDHARRLAGTGTRDFFFPVFFLWTSVSKSVIFLFFFEAHI